MRYLIIYQDAHGTERTEHVAGREPQLRACIEKLSRQGHTVCCWAAVGRR